MPKLNTPCIVLFLASLRPSAVLREGLFIALLLSASATLCAQTTEGEASKATQTQDAQTKEPSADSKSSADSKPTGNGASGEMPPVMVPDVEGRQNRLLKQALSDQGVVEIGTGPQKFLALWEPDITGNPYGAVLLLPTEGHNINWPKSTQALRTGLTEYGWSTLSINVPPTKTKKIPARQEEQAASGAETAANEPVEGNTVDKTVEQDKTQTMPPEKAAIKPSTNMKTDKKAPPLETVAQNSLAKAISFLNDKGQFNIVVVAHGNSAPRIARHIDENAKSPARAPQTGKDTKAIIQGPIRALILINARNTVEGQEKNLPMLLNDPALPVLDVFSGQHYLDKIESSQRRDAARKKQFKNYIQLQVIPSTKDTDVFDSTLVKRIRGFLTSHAKGVEIEGKK